MQTRLAYAIDDQTESGLLHALTQAALKPIDDAVRHIYGARLPLPIPVAA